MDAQTLAIILLGLRIIAVVLLGAVLVKQINQMRNTVTDYPYLRYGIFVLTILLFLKQFIPIILDAVVGFGGFYEGRAAAPSILPASYAINNAVGDVLFGVLLAIQHFRKRRQKPDANGGVVY